MMYVWVGLVIVFVLLEALSAQLTSVWFALGAAAALIVAGCGVQSVLIQSAVFVFVSLLALVLTRPLVRRMLKKKVQPTNADRCIGKTAIVTEAIDNLMGKGAAKVGGVEWTARTDAPQETIPEGQTVRVIRIDGVKLIVEQF